MDPYVTCLNLLKLDSIIAIYFITCIFTGQMRGA